MEVRRIKKLNAKYLIYCIKRHCFLINMISHIKAVKYLLIVYAIII